MIPYLRDVNDSNTMAAPRVMRGMHTASICGLPEWSSWPGGWGQTAVHILQGHGVEIIQGGLGDITGVMRIGSGRILQVNDAEELARTQQAEGMAATTVHLGTGFEDTETLYALAASIIEASTNLGHPIYIETHRATCTQDIWRTVELIKVFPGLKFNADLSHWYTGLELVYGDFAEKLDYMQPVFERTAMLHGRIGNSCCMQVDIGDGSENITQVLSPVNFVDDYRQLWQRCCAGFLQHAQAGDVLPFLPELIVPAGYYARAFPDAEGNLCEESDRYQQALLYMTIFDECFSAAQQLMAPT